MGNKRIVLNTLFTVAQSFLGIACGLFSSRWVLGALGQDGFGLFSVVGGMMAFVLLLNTVLTLSASRHFAFAIGKGAELSIDERVEYVGEWFAASFYVHLLLPILLCGIGAVLGEWYIANKLVVAEDLRGVCHWVFRFSLVSAFFAIVSAPYFALYTAKQLIFIRTIFGFGATVLNTIGAYALFYFDSNRIFYHAVMMMGVQVSTTILIVVVACLKFRETRLLFRGVKLHYVRCLFSYGASQLLGVFANALRDQGIAIVVNRFSGLKVNAGQGVGQQVTGRSTIFAAAVMGALMPEITTCLADGRRERAVHLSECVNLFIPISYLLIIFPLLFNVDYILELWLVNPPTHASQFCAIGLMFVYSYALTEGYQQLINANGKIFIYQLFVGISIASSVAIAFVFYMMNYGPVVAVGCGTLIPVALVTIIRIVFVHRLFGLMPLRWVKDSFLPSLLMCGVSYLLSCGISSVIEQGFLNFFVLGGVNAIAIVLLGLLVSKGEGRDFVLQEIRNRMQRKRK